MAKPSDNNISESLTDMKKFNNSRSGMDKVQAAFLGKTYDSFYNKQSTYEENRVNAAGLLRGDGFGPRDEEDDLDKPGILPDKKLSKNVKSKNRKSSKRGRGRKSLKGVKGFNAIFAIKAKRKNGSRQATSGDIRRAGISALKRANASLARFIAARYSAKAIAKYQDYAGRLRRSKRLIKQIVKINANTFRIKGYIIQTDTEGNNPYSCTCPDFSQVSQDARVWLGSKAGPFNPCKHMMAVRDRDKGDKWICINGTCTKNPLGTYNSKAECEAARLNRLFNGGQCDTYYFIETTTGSSPTIYRIGIGGPIELFVLYEDANGNRGGIIGVRVGVDDISTGRYLFSSVPFGFSLASPPNNITIRRADGLIDDCGNMETYCPSALGCTDPIANNYNANAIFNDGSCTYNLGCTDPLANNYDPDATFNDGSCTYDVEGCTDSGATNYNPDATIDDGSCTYDVYGCTDSGATNYNPDATIDDGSCTY